MSVRSAVKAVFTLWVRSRSRAFAACLCLLAPGKRASPPHLPPPPLPPPLLPLLLLLRLLLGAPAREPPTESIAASPTSIISPRGLQPPPVDFPSELSLPLSRSSRSELKPSGCAGLSLPVDFMLPLLGSDCSCWGRAGRAAAAHQLYPESENSTGVAEQLPPIRWPRGFAPSGPPAALHAISNEWRLLSGSRARAEKGRQVEPARREGRGGGAPVVVWRMRVKLRITDMEVLQGRYRLIMVTVQFGPIFSKIEFDHFMPNLDQYELKKTSPKQDLYIFSIHFRMFVLQAWEYEFLNWSCTQQIICVRIPDVFLTETCQKKAIDLIM